MSADRVLVFERRDEGGAWRIEASAGSITISGGTGPEAYSPVTVSREYVAALLDDIKTLDDLAGPTPPPGEQCAVCGISPVYLAGVRVVGPCQDKWGRVRDNCPDLALVTVGADDPGEPIVDEAIGGSAMK